MPFVGLVTLEVRMYCFTLQARSVGLMGTRIPVWFWICLFKIAKDFQNPCGEKYLTVCKHLKVQDFFSVINILFCFPLEDLKVLDSNNSI